MKKSGLRHLTPKEFDAALLEKLTREGRVYIDFPKEVERNAYVREVLDYVQPIREFATEMWQEDIDRLWLDIVSNDVFSNFLSMSYGLQAGHINRYAVTNLVCRMKNSGIYRKETKLEELHLRMEKTNRKNRYYMSSGNYNLSREARMVLKQLFSKSIK